MLSVCVFDTAEGKEVDLVEMLLNDVKDGNNLRRLKSSHKNARISKAPPSRER